MKSITSTILTLITVLLLGNNVTAQTNPLAEVKRFVRGTGDDPSFHSFVIPLDFEKGVGLDDMGNNANKFGNLPPGQLPWFTRIQKSQLYHISVVNNVATYPIAFENPIAAFGSGAGGTPLYTNQIYRFAFNSGGQMPESAMPATFSDFILQVYDKNAFANGALNVTPVQTAGMHLPRKGSSAWTAFSLSGYKLNAQITGIVEVTVQYVETPSTKDQYGVRTLAPLLISFRALTDQYYFVLRYLGATVDSSGDRFMAVTNPSNPNGSPTYSIGFAMDFENMPPWRSTYIHAPQFDRQAMPSVYAGKTLDELLHVNTPIGITPSLAPSACKTIDGSPELRRHPILDKFVSDMGNDPIALANYVSNEIEVTDPISYNENGDVAEKSINLGGVTRSALATFQEGQGSPWEQCALLVYLLRQAGYSAVYMEPEHNKLQMLDFQMSRILKMQIKGALRYDGKPYEPADPNEPGLIPVNYPWVAFYLQSEDRWVHLFPWIKDVEIIEGKDLYKYLPTGFNTGRLLAEKYLIRHPDIVPAGVTDDTLENLLPKYINKTLAANFPNLTLADLGMSIRTRKNYRLQWKDFPVPFRLEGTPTTVESLKNKTNLFDTVSVEVYSNANPTKKVATGDVRMLDLHNRKFLVRHEKTGANAHNLILSLAPYRPDATVSGNFTSDPNMVGRQSLSVALNSTDDYLTVSVRSKRHRNLPTNFAIPDHWVPYLGVTEMLQFSQDRPLRKGDTAGLCFNVGRVTQKMLRVHAEEFWKVQQILAATPTATVDKEILEGTPAFLMGMSYYEKLSRFMDSGTSLHKVNFLSLYAFGLSKASPQRVGGVLPNNGDLNLIQASVDMAYQQAAYVNNGTYHPDSGESYYTQNDDFFSVFISNGSAQEHQIINGFYKESSAISTVRLLQLSFQQTSTILLLRKFNYATAGETNYTVDGVTKKLKEWDPSMWTSVEAAFTGNTGDYNTVYMTPGPVKSSTGAYKGMGAMIFGSGRYSALISANSSTLNGGYGGLWSAPIYNSPPMLSLNVDPFGGSYSMSYSNPTPSFPVIAPPVYTPISYPSYSSYSSNNSYSYSNYQTSYFNNVNLISGGSSFNNAITSIMNDGYSYVGSSGGSVFNTATTFLQNPMDFVYDPVSVTTGEFYIDATDLRLTGPMPLEIRRTYSSQNLADNEYGYGWKMNYEDSLALSDDQSIIYASEPEGSVIAYRRQTDPNLWLPLQADNPRYTNFSQAKPGGLGNLMNSKIVKSTSGSDVLYTQTGADGSVRIFKVRSFPINGLDRNRPYLDTWKDASGNQYTFTYGTDSTATDYGKIRRIVSSNGSFLGFYYDVYGHIVEAYTADGRRLTYEYSSDGDLTTVTLPDASQITYEYATETTTVSGVAQVTSKHLITRETKPNGRILENVYDDNRKVTQQKSTVGTDMVAVVNATFTYETNKTTVKDAYNKPTVYEHDGSRITRITDPLNHSITTEWYTTTDGATGAYAQAVKKTTDKRGLVTEFKYDVRGNMIETKVTGDITGDGISDTAISTASYSSLNLLTQSVGPLGEKIVTAYGNATYPYLPTRVEKWSGSTQVSAITNEYTDVVQGSIFAKGLLQRQYHAQGTPDQAKIEWTYDAHGFPLTQTRETGTSDPTVVTNYSYNLRGELVEEKDALNRTKSYAYDAFGRKTWEEYRENGNLIGWNYAYYNANGEIEWIDGARYNPEDYVWRKYDGAGRIAEETKWRSKAKADGSGVEMALGDDGYATTFYRYDLFGNLLEVKDAGRNSTVMTYDEVGQMLTRKSYQGYASSGTVLALESFTYEPGGQIATQTNPKGGVTTLSYSTAGKIRRQQNPDGTVLEWRYLLDGRVQREPVSHGTYHEYAYDDANLTVTKTLKSIDSGTLATETSVFDKRGNLISRTDAESNVFTYAYDKLNRAVSVTGPSAQAGSPAQVISASFDAAGKVTTTANALGEKTVTTTDIMGRTVQKEIRNGSDVVIHKSVYAYSADHNSVTATEGTGANAIVTTSYTDTFGKPLLTKNADGTFTLSDYDAAGNLVSSKDELGRVTAFTYDGLNRPATQTLPDGATVQFTYDAGGNLTDRLMPGGLKWHAAYDNANRKISEQLQNSSTTSRQYSYAYYDSGAATGKLHTTTDPRGISHETVYDGFLRPQTVTATGGGQGGLTVSYAYDKRNLVTQADQSYGTGSDGPATRIQRGYDAYGQVKSEVVSVGGTAISTLNQTWDGTGRRASLSDPTSSLGAFNFGWRADGNLAQVGFHNQTYTFSYADNGLLAGRSNPWRSLSISQRDSSGRILQQNNTVGASTPLAETLTWRNDSTLNSYAANRVGLNVWNENRAYSYNSRGQLTGEGFAPTNTQSALLNYAFDNSTAGVGVRTMAKVGIGKPNYWEYDAQTVDSLARVTVDWNNGQKRTVTATGNALGAESVDVAVDNELAFPVTPFGGSEGAGQWSTLLSLYPGTHSLVATAHHPSGQFNPTATSSFTVARAEETVTSAYDADGNVTSRTWSSGKVQTLTWDAVGRLIKVVQRDGNNNGYDWSAVYDVMGRRLQTIYQAVANNAPNGTANIVQSQYDPEVEFLEVSVALNSQKSWKVYGPDTNGEYGGLQGIGGLEAIVAETGTTVGIITDSFGNAVATSDGTNIVWSSTQVGGYGPLPGIDVSVLETGGTTVDKALVWQGRRIDATGFYYMGARYYEPGAGRFLSADPSGHASSMSLYDYANGDPVNNLDPDGRVGKSSSYSGYNNSSINSIMDSYVSNQMAAYTQPTLSEMNTKSFRTFVQNEYGVTLTDRDDDRMFSGMMNMLPVISTIKSGYEAYTGRDMVTGENINQNAATINFALSTLAFIPQARALAVTSSIARSEAGALTSAARSFYGAAARSTAPATQLEFAFVGSVERQTVARDFYRATTAWSDTRIASHLRGIDFSKPVEIVDVPAGTTLTQYNLPGRTGNYYAPSGTPANTLGIYTSGLIQTNHTFATPTRALRSTAAPIIDDWSMSGAGWRIEAGGGGTQFFIPNR